METPANPARFNAGEMEKPSHLRVLEANTDFGNDPIVDLLTLVRERQLRADVVVSPGDLGDKASPDGIQWGWQAIQRIGSAVGARLITAATGNHDQDSRYIFSQYDSREVLQRLDPPYPLSDNALNDKYFAKHYAIVNDPDFRLVLLNTSAHHGGKSDEQGHGRVSPFTLELIRKELVAQQPAPLVNILVCHHHPQLYPELKQRKDQPYEVMRNGEDLIDILDQGGIGEWLIVHGHRHHPRLTYANGKGVPPVILSAGSLSACLYPSLATQTKNQFYVVDIPLTLVPKIGLVGIIEAWDWSKGRGWQPASQGTGGLPARGGFGARVHPKQFANRVAQAVGGSPFVSWATIRDAIPELDYLLPEAMKELGAMLESHHGMSIELDEHGVPQKVGRRGARGG